MFFTCVPVNEIRKWTVNVAVVPKYNEMQAYTGYGDEYPHILGKGDTLPPSNTHACLYLQERFVAQCASSRCWNSQRKDNGKTCEVHLRSPDKTKSCSLFENELLCSPRKINCWRLYEDWSENLQQSLWMHISYPHRNLISVLSSEQASEFSVKNNK